MKWYYYICCYGPGHMGESDGFVQHDDKVSLSEIGRQIVDDYSDHDWPIARVWPVDKLPAEYLAEKIEDLKDTIKYAKQELKELQTLQGVECPSEDGKDEQLAKRLGRCQSHSLMKTLHNQGLIVRRRTVKEWGCYGKKHPAATVLPQVLTAIRRAKKNTLITAEKNASKPLDNLNPSAIIHPPISQGWRE